MRIAVTGASSFIGKAFIECAAKQGHECIAIVRKRGTIGISRLCTLVQRMEMEEYADLGRNFPDIDCLVCLAWDGTRGSARMDAERQRKNYEWSLSGIKSMLHAGCRLIVTAGSQAEYGSYNGIITENTKLCPNTEYGKYKAMLYSDAAYACEQSGAVLIEPRYFSLYGPGDFKKSLIMDTVKRMLKNEPCELTQCIQMWDFLHISDASNALIKLIECENAKGAYNFGSGDCRKLYEFIEEMRTLLKSRSKLNYGKIAYPDTGMVSIQPDITKLKDTIGWKPEISFAEGIMGTAEVLKDEDG